MEYPVCRSCGASLNETDKYCSECGNLTCAVEFDPYSSRGMFECVYGPPPVKRVYKCDQCGKELSTFEMIEHTKYCPSCGNSIKKISDGDDHSII